MTSTGPQMPHSSGGIESSVQELISIIDREESVDTGNHERLSAIRDSIRQLHRLCSNEDPAIFLIGQIVDDANVAITNAESRAAFKGHCEEILSDIRDNATGRPRNANWPNKLANSFDIHTTGVFVAAWLVLGALPMFLVMVGTLAAQGVPAKWTSTAGAIGDAFGLANSFFSGFALLLIIHTARLQQKSLAIQQTELRLSREEMRLSGESQREQARQLANQVRVTTEQLNATLAAAQATSDSAVAAARSNELTALHRLYADYRRPEMYLAVKSLWKLHTDKRSLEANYDSQLEGDVNAEREHSIPSNDIIRKAINYKLQIATSFYTYMAGLLSQNAVTEEAIFSYWSLDELEIIPKVIVPLRKHVGPSVLSPQTEGNRVELLLNQLYERARRWNCEAPAPD